MLQLYNDFPFQRCKWKWNDELNNKKKITHSIWTRVTLAHYHLTRKLKTRTWNKNMFFPSNQNNQNNFYIKKKNTLKNFWLFFSFVHLCGWHFIFYFILTLSLSFFLSSPVLYKFAKKKIWKIKQNLINKKKPTSMCILYGKVMKKNI